MIVGKQAIDDDSNQTGQMLAGLLDWPQVTLTGSWLCLKLCSFFARSIATRYARQATFASKVEVSNGVLNVTREVDGGLETISTKTPAIISADLRLNTPRYATLPNIMKAKKKPLAVWKKDKELAGLDLDPRLEVLEVTEPAKREGGKKVESVDEVG